MASNKKILSVFHFTIHAIYAVFNGVFGMLETQLKLYIHNLETFNKKYIFNEMHGG